MALRLCIVFQLCNDLAEELQLVLLHGNQFQPLLFPELINLFMEHGYLKLCLQVDFVIVLRAEAVGGSLSVLRHQYDGGLDSRQHG